MIPTDDDWDDEQFEGLLAAAGRDAVPPDPAWLQRLRDQSTEVFLASTGPSPPLHHKGRFMTARNLQILAASVAAMFLVAAGLYWYFPSTEAEPAFGQALDKAAHVQTIHCRITQQGKTYEVWAAQPGRLRRNAPDGTYQIAEAGKLWQVDEKANRATMRPSPYHRPEFDLLALLPMPVGDDRSALIRELPSGRVENDGIDCFVYRMEVPGAEGDVEIEALVERSTGLPRSVQAQGVRDGKRELLAALNVLAYNEPVPEDKFVVRDTLTEDGRVGNITDIQGVVALKPVQQQRWTPIVGHMLVKPGDWLRTDARGANAATLRLVKRTRVILGPGTIIEVIKPDQIRLIEGQVEVAAPDGASLEVLDHEKEKVVVKGTKLYRVGKDRFVQVKKEPLWLKAFKGKTNNESLGSLIAGVDGRDVPLTVGEHKVTVDIRDQIARTTIEETFVNHTGGVLEGVFHFPLPDGASVSGFAMWIGDKMIEADVVEKQRAREIYEIILQEKRDPGLLEWTGGNIFKARVYPIFANSEKRVRITYTQVLPFKGGSYRYSYALQSELLQLNPLRELAIDVKVNSAVPLKNVTCPTHPARLDKTGHSAHVEFAAQQYAPARDFEVVIEVDRPQKGGPGGTEAVLIPHRRGEDGYFMMQLSAPGPDAVERAILADGRPLNLLLLADTSASMDAGQRKVQANFLTALLTALTPRDTLNVAACDVECDWVFEKPVPASSENLAAVRDFLARRTSLGWTDLDRAFTAALRKTGRDTQIIYIGDGIVTAGAADPVALGKRLRQLYEEKNKEGGAGTCHAVTTGSSYDASVLQTIASLGSGSVRHIGGAEGPSAVALELLGEMTAPPVRDLKVEFRGLRTASVYPERLPNLAAGTQQILLGRYLPEGRDQVGEVIVTGTLAGQPVRFSTRVALADAEKGNSFIPRLWARMHLDHLLAQGARAGIQDEIIALSEEYNILTPYTSLLVLESDADRERFKVKTRFRMRDGEKFFAQGRDNANYELKQQQMKRAGDWRLALHRRVLNQLAGLGRNVRRLQGERGEYLADSRFKGRLGALPMGGMAAGDWGGELKDLGEFGLDLGEMGFPSRRGAAEPSIATTASVDKAEAKEEKDSKEPADREADEDKRKDSIEDETLRQEDFAYERDGLFERSAGLREAGRIAGGARRPDPMSEASPYLNLLDRSRQGQERSRSLTALFPDLPPPTVAKGQKPVWSAAARALAKSLLRAEKFARMQGGLEVVQQVEAFDARWGDLVSRSRTRALISPAAVLTRSEGDGEATFVRWCDGRERGVISRAFQLGRIRPAGPGDLAGVPLDFGDYSLTTLEQTHGHYPATLEPQEDGQTLLVLKYPSNPGYQTRILVDTVRNVIVRIEQHADGKTTAVTKFEDFVEAAGSWWARRIETLDEHGRLSSRTKLTVHALSAGEMVKGLKDGLAGRDTVLFLHQPFKTIAAAKQALAGGKPTFDDHLALLLHFTSGQQWTRAKVHLQECEKLAADKPGMRFLHNEFLLVSRRHEELRKRLLEEAGRLAKADPNPGDDLALAQYFVSQGRQILEANEQLALLDLLKPIYARQPAHRQALKEWLQLRLASLQHTGQHEERLRVQKQLATDWPHDVNLQQQYAQALANAGDYAGAYAWLERVLTGEPRWLLHEEESLRNTHAQLLEGQGRYADLADYLAGWLKTKPDSYYPYGQYLSALIRSDKLDRANALGAQWLREGQTPSAPTPSAAARLQAAIGLALGQGHNLYTNRIEERWLTPLADAALFFLRHEARAADAHSILSNWQFQRSDEGRRVQKVLATRLAAEIATLSPAQVQTSLQWISSGEPGLEPAAWKRISDTLQERWTKEADSERKHVLGQSLVQVLSRQDNPIALISFLHARLQKAPEEYRPSYVAALFDTFLSQPWSAEYEDEAFALLSQLTNADEPSQRLFAQVNALHRLTDSMIEARRTARMKAVEHPEKLTRQELKKKQDEALKLARTGFADHLRTLADKKPGPLTPWLKIEQFYLDTRLERDLKQVAAECFEFLGAVPKKVETVEEPDAAQHLNETLHDRHMLTLMHLAARKSADPALVERLLKFLDTGIAQEDKSGHWKQLKYGLLIALDRPKDLEKALQSWVHSGDADNRWRLALGYVLAEQGRVPEAIKLLEAIEASDELGPTAYRALAGWYLAVNRRTDHERAQLASYRTTEEWQLQRLLAYRQRPWQRSDGQPPTEVDREVLFQFAALFEKSSAPQNHLWLLRDYFQHTRDFRLLTGMADAVVGHTAAGVYPFLTASQSVLTEIGDEATVDELVLHLAKIRGRAKTEVDRRGLDLLEMLVQRRAAELKNQGGPHADAALAALQRAFKGEWSAGEPKLMADLLANLGAIPQALLAREQVRQLEVLHRREAKGSFDHLHIGQRLAETHHGYGRPDQALTLLEAALAEYQEASKGVLPPPANSALDTFVSFLEAARQHDRAEKFLLDQLRHPAHAEQSRWLTLRLNKLYHNALVNNGDVSLGNGLKLYQALERKLRADLATPDPNHKQELIYLLMSVYSTADAKKLAGVHEDLKTFGRERLPQVLKPPTNTYQNIVNHFAQSIRNIIGPKDGIEFLLDQIDREPVWFRLANQDGWSQYSWTIAQWRLDAKDVGDLDKRLLPLVLAELRRDLASGQQRNRVLYFRQNAYFWAEKEADFVLVAEDVLAKRPESGSTAQYIANYFYYGLNQPARAIEILATAHKRKLLDDSGQVELVQFLHWQSRHAESIPVLEPLVERNPANLAYRTQLLHAYYHAKRGADLLALLKKTDAFFHEKDRWTEGVMASLGASCLENRLYTQSAAYYNEVIPLHQRTNPRRGVGNGTLSSYYANLARAYAGLNKTAEAVDAASGAIVSWGATHQNRTQAVEALRQVLRESTDLDGYVAALDKQTAASGVDSAIIRKALGHVYRDKAAYPMAIKQLRLAIALQPNDAETHRLLIDCFNKQNDKQGVILAYLDAVQVLRRDIALYQDLGKRLADQPKEEERAYTSIVEVLPSESEGHAMLAEVRQHQGRWTEAIMQWEHVARIRALEPTGLLKLAAAQIHQGQWDAAAQSVAKLKARTWPARFNTIGNEVRKLEEQIKVRKGDN
jgi:Vault protein inter-alpha-trypsin domain/von Willebrand factor type A domain